MNQNINLTIVAFITVLLSVTQAQGQHKSGTHAPGMSHEEMNKRGEEVMGFNQTETTHHFVLLQEGGAIEVEANRADDASNQNKIRKHLSEIAKMFAKGNFSAPFLIHEQNPPGVPVMKRLKNEIEYKLEKTARGARVLISTKNGKALKAIHDFLRFQITEHQTGDSLEVR